MKIEIHPPLSIYELGQRDNQEDNIYPQLGRTTAADRLFLVCDGMGGHERGEVASSIVCQAIPQYFQQAGIISDKGLADDDLRNAVENAFQQLDRADDGAMKKMGTTLTLLYMHRCGVTCAHIGDSRIYHIRPQSSSPSGRLGGAILYQSRDHSLVFDLYQAGEITYEEMATLPQKNIITRAMQPGEENRMRPDIVHITDVQPGDYFYMCSDGMLEQMTNEELVALLSSDISDEEKRSQLIKATANNKDNHSAWLIHVKDVIKEDGDDKLVNEEPTSRCNAINIIQPTNTKPDVQIADSDDDVKIVSSPPTPAKKRFPFIKAVIAGLLCVALLAVATVLLFKKNDKEKLQRPQPMMKIPIQRHILKDSTKDTIITDSNKQRNNEPTGNQQPVNAPRGNDSPRNLQNR